MITDLHLVYMALDGAADSCLWFLSTEEVLCRSHDITPLNNSILRICIDVMRRCASAMCSLGPLLMSLSGIPLVFHCLLMAEFLKFNHKD